MFRIIAWASAFIGCTLFWIACFLYVMHMIGR